MKKSVIFIWLFEKKVYFTIYYAKHKKNSAYSHELTLPLYYLTLCDYGSN